MTFETMVKRQLRSLFFFWILQEQHSWVEDAIAYDVHIFLRFYSKTVSILLSQ